MNRVVEMRVILGLEGKETVGRRLESTFMGGLDRNAEIGVPYGSRNASTPRPELVCTSQTFKRESGNLGYLWEYDNGEEIQSQEFLNKTWKNIPMGTVPDPGRARRHSALLVGYLFLRIRIRAVSPCLGGIATKGLHDQVNMIGKIDIEYSLQAPVKAGAFFYTLLGHEQVCNVSGICAGKLQFTWFTRTLFSKEES